MCRSREKELQLKKKKNLTGNVGVSECHICKEKQELYNLNVIQDMCNWLGIF